MGCKNKMSKKAKFECAYVKTYGQLIEASKLIQMKSGSIDDEGIDLDNDVFCPECKKTHLVIVNKISGDDYIRRSTQKENPEHDPKCTYEFEVAGKKESKAYFQKKNPSEIQHDLTQLLKEDIAVRERDPNAPKIMRKVNSEMVFSTNKANNHVRKRVPQQKLTEAFAKNLKSEHAGDGFAKYYYGRVKVLKRESKKKFENYQILSSNGLVFFSLGVLNNLKDLTETLSKASNLKVPINLAIYGEIKFNRIYRDLVVFNENCCVIRE